MGAVLSLEEVIRRLEAVDWSRTRSFSGLSDFVPGAFRRLIAARDDAEASRAYWDLDNEVVAQGTIYEAAAKLTPAILAALDLEVTPVARHHIVELLTEIALGKMDPKDRVADGPSVEDDIHRQIREHLDAVYALMSDVDPRVRRAVFHVLDAVEEDRERLSTVAHAVAVEDSDDELRRLARRWVEDTKRPSR